MRKNYLLVLAALLLCALLAYFAFDTNIFIDKQSKWIYRLSMCNAMIWLLNMFWGINILVFQIAALFKNKSRGNIGAAKIPNSITVIYTTCDDFNEDCCLSCLKQEYEHPYKVFIADDSKNPNIKSQIDSFVARQKMRNHLPQKIEIIRRDTKNGFKAGNLNNAIEQTESEWICLVDADQYLPPNYLTEASSYIDNDPKLGFIQGVNSASYDEDENLPFDTQTNYFQKAMSPEVAMYYYRDLAPRERFGFLPMLGHGALISRKAWKTVGGFPEIVAEDFGYTMRLFNKKYYGKYAESAQSFEKYPMNFACFLIRVKKFAKGAGELLRKSVPAFLSKNWFRVRGLDFFMLYSWYWLAPFVFLNLFLSAYLTNYYFKEDILYMSEFMTHVITALFVSTLAILISISNSVTSFFRLFFWLFASYASTMPLMVWNFIKSLFVSPRFTVTPKIGKHHALPVTESVAMVLLGVLTIATSLRWLSPFSPYLFAHGLAYGFFPLYNQFHKSTFSARAGRKLVYIPGLFIIGAILILWNFNYDFINEIFAHLGLNN